jgi:hypothetical protein
MPSFGLLPLGGQEFLFVFAILFVLIIPFWRIFSKAGFPGWFGVGILIPIVNIALILLLAFSEWPLERKVRSVGGVEAGR